MASPIMSTAAYAQVCPGAPIKKKKPQDSDDEATANKATVKKVLKFDSCQDSEAGNNNSRSAQP